MIDKCKFYKCEDFTFYGGYSEIYGVDKESREKIEIEIFKVYISFLKF